MAKQTVENLGSLAGKKVLVRVDFNVPQDAQGNVTNDRRVRAAVPTIKSLLAQGASVIAMSHLGRPKGDPVKDAPFKMDKVAEALSKHLGIKVQKANDVAGEDSARLAASLKQGEVLLLENLRFHTGEQTGCDKLALQIARLGDVYV